ncbi:hypothetical protein SAMN05660209_03347 [Geodermatophilus africanus]|uniref:Uncharacterized protein n=1 Tax=Geodermatophilus africanus TaxID=1137993 RepID=A0A1H3LIG4_9ACTN|nr:hypothetical protein [Geodermatophilus africanus]SDY63758.1 hypothetical protein SAMN05660209_03347 [Geodermatophilus africanus]
MDDDRAGRLLAAPRGRRTLAELLDEPLSVHASGGEEVRWRDEVRRRVAATDPAAIVEQGRLLAALTASVDWAVYWQEPHGEDRVLADDSVAAELAPIVAAVARAPASQWWTEPLTVEAQHAVSWPDSDGLISTPRTSGARVGLAAWRDETLADEVRARRERPADPRANWSGVW